MTQLKKVAAVLACLALSPAMAPACQLSLLGAATQQPLTYNPFQAAASAALVSFTFKNTDSKPCNAAFAFFKPGALQASAAGAVLNYQILSTSGHPVVQAEHTPPHVLGNHAAAAAIAVGPKQTVTAQAAVLVGAGQVVGPGSYTDQLILAVYQSAGAGSPYVRAIPEATLGVLVTVNSQMILTVAGGGRTTTLDFGNLVQGAVRSVHLLAYANQGFHLIVSSENAGVMRPFSAAAPAEGQVPYTVAIFGTAAIDLSRQRAVSLWPKATQSSGLTVPIDVQIGSIAGQPAGLYRDVITIAIDAGP